MKKNQLKQELISLNNDLYSEFSIQELEQRLETDPLLFVDFFQEGISAAGDTCRDGGTLNVCESGATLNACSAPEALST